MAHNDPFQNGNPPQYRNLQNYPPYPPQLPKRGYSTRTKVLLGCAIVIGIIVVGIPLLIGVCIAVGVMNSN